MNAIDFLSCSFLSNNGAVLYRCIISEDNSTVINAAKDVADDYITVGADSLFGYSAEDSPNWVSNFFSSLWVLRGYIFGFGIGVAVFFAFVYLYLLRIPGLLAIIIWTILLSVFVLFCVASFLLWDLAKQWNEADSDRSDTEVQGMYVVSYIGFAVTGLYACLLLVMRKRIMLAIGIVKEAARALGAMPALLFLPIVQAIGMVLFLVPWTIYVLYLASSGSVSTQETDAGSYQTFEYTDNAKYAFIYLLFCYFWAAELIVAIGQLVVAASFAGWYFTREKALMMNSTVFWVRN
jgi:choline transporter-like protein 2/4/5